MIKFAAMRWTVVEDSFRNPDWSRHWVLSKISETLRLNKLEKIFYRMKIINIGL